MWSRLGLALLLVFGPKASLFAQIELEIRRPTAQAAQHEAYDHFLAHLQNRGYDWRPTEADFRRKVLSGASVKASGSYTTLKFRLPSDERLAQWSAQTERGTLGFYAAGVAVLAALVVRLVATRIRR